VSSRTLFLDLIDKKRRPSRPSLFLLQSIMAQSVQHLEQLVVLESLLVPP
jgi:hypothetical protein